MGIALALLFALLGGLALNLMPCVFPVLAIKALGLARQGGAPARQRWLHALAYGAGVLTFFLLVALLLLGLRAGGAAVGWGFQLQSPVFVALMAYLFLVLGLSLAGAVTIGTRLMGLGAVGHELGFGSGPNPSSQGSHVGDFVTGALAALVAAPCTAPFMGAALGYAVTLPWPPALAIMLTLGVGMALPFMALALLPRLADRLPRPGPWMEYLKQLLAFPMFATAAWLVWVLSIQTGPAGVAAILAGMVALSLALWLQERARHAVAPWRQTALGSALLALVAALWLGIGTAGLDAPATLASAPSLTTQQLRPVDSMSSLTRPQRSTMPDPRAGRSLST
jgi:thiol:disulfide interchange protein